MKKLQTIALAAVVVLLGSCGSKVSQNHYNEKSQVLSANYDGSYVVRTQVRGRNAAVDFTDAQRKVVKEALFDGIEAANSGVEALKPIILDKNAQAKYEDYFNAFFQDKGEWTNYASLQDKRAGTTQYNRARSQMVETVTVTLKRAELKKKMQEDGIIPKENMYQL